ncbi:unnamed protein product [Pleuronectes platessa]|uniref:Uncharacterized protein n=1 Tax=Pleuronectes platessa TaxID=8262 RepID=A0A9N7U8N8_PLEPL|nr:unnamed protein product [Pleuronectes platessa]
MPRAYLHPPGQTQPGSVDDEKCYFIAPHVRPGLSRCQPVSSAVRRSGEESVSTGKQRLKEQPELDEDKELRGALRLQRRWGGGGASSLQQLPRSGVEPTPMAAAAAAQIRGRGTGSGQATRVTNTEVVGP